MLFQSRLSPFAYSKARRERKEGKEICPQSSSSKPKKFMRWFPLIEAVMLSRKKVLLPVKNLRNSLQLSSELHRTLYGFIVFEVAWAGVRGINYYNELQVLDLFACFLLFSQITVYTIIYWVISFVLQTDTSLAIEAKLMKRWEFDSIAQAADCMSSWFSGTPSEKLLLKEHLDSASGVNSNSHHCFQT